VTEPAPAAPSDTPRTAAQRRRDRERAKARRAILNAAREIARREGWDAVTMRRLAEEIEYSANFAYRYFEGRDDILLALVRDGFTQLRDEVAAAAQPTKPSSEPAAGRKASGDEGAAVRRAGHAYLDFALADPDLYQLMYSLGGVRVPVTDTWTEGQAIGDIFIGLLAAAGDARPEEHVLQLWATAHGLIALQVVGRVDVDAAALHALFDNALTDCLVRALAPARSTARNAATRERSQR
jgi:AcrR family transcriptional regulator